MARIFSGVINKEYVGKIKHILFAILGNDFCYQYIDLIEDENSRREHNPQGNLLPFRDIFERKEIPVELEQKAEEISGNVIEFFSVKESNGYLSNFSKHGFKLKGKEWPTAAHYIEAQKYAGKPAGTEKLRNKYIHFCLEEEIREAKTPQIAEKISHSYSKKIRSDWATVREEVVRNAVEAKFDQNPEIQKLLIETGSDTLVFHAKDNFLGDGLQGHGKNILGKLLMHLRQMYINKS
jgi:ribA/ribD-fused uncharacterized protein